jgi:hypothetical protein
MFHPRYAPARGLAVAAGSTALLMAAFAGPASALGASPAASAANRADRPGCHSSFDPYAYSRTAVQACGYKTFPLVATHLLAGGGHSYDYAVDGMRVRFYTPPAGFNPGTASNARLQEYGFPPRPAKGSSSYVNWQASISHWKQTTAPPSFLAETDAKALSTTNSHWSGYVVTGNAGSFTHAEAWYVEPTIHSSVCSSTAEVTWAGLGGWSTNNLAQDGTGSGVPGMGSHQAWWEILPADTIPVSGLYGQAGSLFDASVRRISGGFRFWLESYGTGKTVAFDVSSGSYDGSSAEAIVERPLVNGSFTDLSNYETTVFEQTEANGVYFNEFNANTQRYGVHMLDGSDHPMATVNTVSTYGSFADTQERCD